MLKIGFEFIIILLFWCHATQNFHAMAVPDYGRDDSRTYPVLRAGDIPGDQHVPNRFVLAAAMPLVALARTESMPPQRRTVR